MRCKHHHRATDKFFQSLLSISKSELSKIDYTVMPRGQMFVGIDKEPIKSLNLHSALKSVALIGDNRSGKTIFLSLTVLNDMFPLWYRYIFPHVVSEVCNSRCLAQESDCNTEKDNPWPAVMDLLLQRRDEQRMREFLHMLFKTKLPAFLKPQPAIIVVDQAEELLRAYRADFLMGFYNLVKKGPFGSLPFGSGHQH